MDLHAPLEHYFGFADFRPGQQAALGHVLAGRDTLVVMPTGSGKSLIYQLAALLLPGTALVISPLVALMKDQVDGLERRGLPATFINSSLVPGEQSRRLQALAEGAYKLVLVAPERLRSPAFRQALRRVPLSLLAVDEAHCLSQWGHDFRPDYLRLAQARQEFQAPVTLALTATATVRVQDDILRLLGLERAERLVAGFNRPNLTFEVYTASSQAAKHRLLRELLGQAGPLSESAERSSTAQAQAWAEGGTIVYTGTRREAEAVAAFAGERAGLRARAYHAGLDGPTRSEVQDAFLSGDLPVVAATNAFGMGIDRPDVRLVLHYNLPGSLEAYYQEAGRAGRDGLPARAVLLYSPQDTLLHEHFIDNDAPSAEDLRAVHDFAGGPGAEGGFALDELERATGVSEIKGRVALEQLQAAGALEPLPDEGLSLRKYQARPLPEAALRAISRQVQQRREHKRAQLARVVSYAQTDACRRRALLSHFGDKGPAEAAAACCDNCQAQAEAERQAHSEAEAQRPASTQAERAALIVLDTLAHLQWPVGKALLAGILKGSSAKAAARYARARNFGKLAALSTAAVEGLVGQLVDAGYLRYQGTDRPVLGLTARGQAALKARLAISVTVPGLRADAAHPAAAGSRSIPADPSRRVAAALAAAEARAAGGTVALTSQMLSRGLSPEQIALERGLSLETIYSHLATLIGEGRLALDAVVPAAVQAQVRAAIEAEGSAQYLSPLKARLPESIGYGVIRCVVAEWRRMKDEG